MALFWIQQMPFCQIAFQILRRGWQNWHGSCFSALAINPHTCRMLQTDIPDTEVAQFLNPG